MKFQTAILGVLALGLFSLSNAYAVEKKAPTLGDVAASITKDMNDLTSLMEEYIEVSVKCLQESDKAKIDSCTVNELNKLSTKGSFVAQHALGNYYEEMGDKAKAIEYYKLALKNPKLSKEYKLEVLRDLERAQK